MHRSSAILLPVLMLAALLALPTVEAISNPVTQEWAVTGTTSGLPGAQVEDGLQETLTEADAAADPNTYPSTQTVTTGSQVAGAFPVGVQASDNSDIQYREAPSGPSTTVSRNPGATASGPDCNFATGDNGRLSDNLYATSATKTERCLYTTFGFSLPAGSSIQGVELGYETYTLGTDFWAVTVSWNGGSNFCTETSTGTLPSTDPNAYTYLNFTSCRPWSAADVNSIASRFTHDKTAGPPNPIYLDASVVRVTYIPPGNFQLSLSYDWTGVPAGQSQRLTVEGRMSDEDIRIQVLTPPATWNTRLTLSSSTDQVLTYDLTAGEYNGGNPSIRLVDALGAEGSQSDLWLDEVRITTTVVDHRLDIRQNITGIIGVSPALRIKGNISAGGENFDVYAWNFTAGVWDLRLASPFTTTNAYHNVSLPPQDISGGIVRLRFRDTVGSDLTPHALSLDLVEIFTVPGNAPPGMPSDGVIPVQGNLTTTFAFHVRYADVDNDPPAYVRLRFNGTLYDMVANDTGDTNYADGKDYRYNLTIGVRGTFNYNFTTQASAGDTTVVTTATRQVQVLNRAPTITNPIGSDSRHSGLYYSRDFNATDPDLDGLTWSLATNATWLSIGPTNGTLWGMAPLAVASYYVNATVNDGMGGQGHVNYTLAVVDQRPAITNPILSEVHHPLSYRRDFNATDADGDTLTWSISTNATWLSIGTANGTLWGTRPLGNFSYYVRVTVSDPVGLADSVNYSLTVGNLRPAVLGSGNETVHAGAFYRRTLVATDGDNDTLTWSLATSATWLRIGASNGTLCGGAPGTLTSYYVNVTVDDTLGGRASRNFTLTLGNTPPIITAGGGNSSQLRAPYTRALAGNDPDGDIPLWSLVTNGTFLSINATTGAISTTGTPPPGTFYLLVILADGLGGSDTVNFTVVFINRAPTISGVPPLTAVPGTSYVATLTASDPDSDVLAWSLTTNASWLTIDASGRLSGTAVAGTYFANVTVRDTYGGSVHLNYTLVVRPGVARWPLPDWLFLGLVVGGLGVAIGLGALAATRRKPKGDVILKAFLFTDKAVLMQEMASDQEDPPVKLSQIIKAIPGGRIPGEHWMELTPYWVAVVEQEKLHLAAVSRVKRRSLVMAEAHKVLQDMMEDEELPAPTPSQPPT